MTRTHDEHETNGPPGETGVLRVRLAENIYDLEVWLQLGGGITNHPAAPQEPALVERMATALLPDAHHHILAAAIAGKKHLAVVRQGVPELLARTLKDFLSAELCIVARAAVSRCPIVRAVRFHLLLRARSRCHDGRCGETPARNLQAWETKVA